MTRLIDFIAIMWLVTALLSSGDSALAQTEHSLAVKNEHGLQLLAVTEAMQPTLRVVLPGHGSSDRSIEVLVPEHVTAVRHGSTAAEHLFLPRPGSPVARPAWRSVGRSLEYKIDLPGDVNMV